MTIDAIVAAVTHELTNGVGIERVRAMDALAARLNAKDLRAARALLRARPGISFSVNTTQAQSDTRTISIRAHGVDCGFVSFERVGRMFTPSPKFRRHWPSDKPRSLEWREVAVARFVAACERHAREEYWPRESRIQELLFRQMQGGGRKKAGCLRGLQPVLFGGVPIQLPSAVTPRGASGKLGKQKGHSDLVARSREQGRLVVFEIKRPAADSAECIGALEQAVRYAAALDYLMGREEHRAAYWRLLGSRRGPGHQPSFSAVAFLGKAGSAGCERDLRAKLAELLAGNSRQYGLSVMLYHEVGNSIEVAGEITA